MGSADPDATETTLLYESIDPSRVLEIVGEPVPLTYEYPILTNLVDTQAIASQCDTAEMRHHLEQRGFRVIKPTEEEGQRLLEELNANANTELNKASNDFKTVRIGVGTPIMVERDDKSERRQKINVIFAIVEANKGRLDGGEKYIVAHPVDKDGLNQLTLSGQHRSDNQNSFEPTLWMIQPKYPFGWHGGSYPHVVSYPREETKKM